jgi:hypothetical protein
MIGLKPTTRQLINRAVLAWVILSGLLHGGYAHA